MNLDLTLDGIAVSTDPEDAELASHVKDTARSVRDLATYVARESIEQCGNCGDKRPTRPLGLVNEQGRVRKVPVCAECQEEFIDHRIEQQQADPPEDDDA